MNESVEVSQFLSGTLIGFAFLQVYANRESAV